MTFFKKDAIAFSAPLNSPNNPNMFIFFETYFFLNQKNRTTLRVSTKRPKIGCFEPNKRGTKIKKVRQNCQYLIFFNEIFTVYAASDEEYEKIKIKNFGLQKARMGTHDPLDQSVEYCYICMRCSTKVIYFLKRSYMGLSEKKIKWVAFEKKFFEFFLSGSPLWGKNLPKFFFTQIHTPIESSSRVYLKYVVFK